DNNYPLLLEKTDTPPKVNRPQNPVPPFPYKEDDVKFENGNAGITLAGTLTIPETDPPHPAVVLITGSGAQDRDETIFGHKPFWIIADYLSRRGVAVLRYDDRGFGKSTGDFKTATSEDFAGDVNAAVAYLKTKNGIDSKQIGLIGHSEGAIIAPIVAAQHPEIAFAVLLAASGVVGEEILYEQTELINKANGVSDFLISWNRAMQVEFFNTLKTEPNLDSARAKIKAMMIDKVAMLKDDEKQTLGLTEQIVTSQIEGFTSPWFKAFLTYDPIPTIQRVNCPLLVLYGELDLQTPPEQNAKMIEQALLESGHKDYTVKILPGMNHLFQTAAIGSPKVYGIIPETFSPIALETMSEWILERVQ
ncbi:MAG: alpha/beta hydrolase family protein, partial [Candidatus Zixiibacteriota bacterium]